MSFVDDDNESDRFESLPASPNADESFSWDFKGKSVDKSLTVVMIHFWLLEPDPLPGKDLDPEPPFSSPPSSRSPSPPPSPSFPSGALDGKELLLYVPIRDSSPSLC